MLAAKTFDAKPVGVFSSAGKRALFHLFQRDGKPILIASSSEEAGEEVPLAVGTPSVRITDYQGNETTLPAAGGVARLPLAPLRCFVEGADLDVLKTYLVPAVDVPSAGGNRDLGAGTPQIALLAGKPGAVRIRLRNPYARPLGGTLRLDLPESWLREREASFSLQPGEQKIVTVPVTVPRVQPSGRIPPSAPSDVRLAEAPGGEQAVCGLGDLAGKRRQPARATATSSRSRRTARRPSTGAGPMPSSYPARAWDRAWASTCSVSAAPTVGHTTASRSLCAAA